MKKLPLLVVCFLYSTLTFSQTYLKLSNTEFKELKEEGEPFEKSSLIKIGASIGYNFGLYRLYDVAVNPVDNSIQFESLGKTSVVLSTAIMVSPKSYGLRAIQSGSSANLANTEGKIIKVPGRLSFGLIVNVAQFSSEAKVYNQKIDGGLGLGWRFTDNFSALLSYEFQSVRQPRQYFIDSYKGLNKQLVINESQVTSINFEENNLFTNKYLPAISLKAVVILNPTKTPDQESSPTEEGLTRKTKKEADKAQKKAEEARKKAEQQN